jgi:DNA-binding transcriptional regulator YiaG
MNLNTLLGELITKGALRVTRKPIVALRHDVADLKRQVAELQRLLRAVRKDAVRKDAGSCAVPTPASEAEADTVTSVRIRPNGPMVRKLRKRLGLTQVELSRLVGVSSLTVSKWESATGRIYLRNRTLAALAKIRIMGKREAKAALANG